MARCVLLLLVWALMLTPTHTAQAQASGPDQTMFTRLLRRYVNNDGRVNYVGLARDTDFTGFIIAMGRVDPDKIKGRNERMAFWINMYNAYTMRLITRHSRARSVRDIPTPAGKTPWQLDFIRINGKSYTLDDIEKEILLKEFPDEPRIHFALVCAANSCAKLRREAYRADILDRQLDEQARRFLGDKTLNRIDPRTGKLYLSMIFDWYKDDFTSSGGTVQKFLAPYFAGELRSDLQRNAYQIEYLPYDWSLNEDRGR